MNIAFAFLVIAALTVIGAVNGDSDLCKQDSDCNSAERYCDLALSGCVPYSKINDTCGAGKFYNAGPRHISGWTVKKCQPGLVCQKSDRPSVGLSGKCVAGDEASNDSTVGDNQGVEFPPCASDKDCNARSYCEPSFYGCVVYSKFKEPCGHGQYSNVGPSHKNGSFVKKCQVGLDCEDAGIPYSTHGFSGKCVVSMPDLLELKVEEKKKMTTTMDHPLCSADADCDSASYCEKAFSGCVPYSKINDSCGAGKFYNAGPRHISGWAVKKCQEGLVCQKSDRPSVGLSGKCVAAPPPPTTTDSSHAASTAAAEDGEGERTPCSSDANCDAKSYCETSYGGCLSYSKEGELCGRSKFYNAGPRHVSGWGYKRCEAGLLCLGGSPRPVLTAKCVRPPAEPNALETNDDDDAPKACSADSFCEDGMYCLEGFCFSYAAFGKPCGLSRLQVPGHLLTYGELKCQPSLSCIKLVPQGSGVCLLSHLVQKEDK